MFLNVGGARLFTASFGPADGPVLLATGGWIGSWELWVGPFEVMSARRRTIGFDHRGVGATVAPVGSIGFDRLVDDVVAVMDGLGIRRCALAGESAGGGVALAAAARHPDRFDALVLVSPHLPSVDGPPHDDPFDAALHAAYAHALDGFVAACLPEPGTEDIARWGRAILDRATPEAAIALYRMRATSDLWEEARAVTVPTLILHGDADRIVPLASSEQLAGVIPDARLEVLGGAGHVPTMTRPHEVASAIETFLGG
jgi:pimeloyl-ACP methyl ester carboxylesterase